MTDSPLFLSAPLPPFFSLLRTFWSYASFDILRFHIPMRIHATRRVLLLMQSRDHFHFDKVGVIDTVHEQKVDKLPWQIVRSSSLPRRRRPFSSLRFFGAMHLVTFFAFIFRRDFAPLGECWCSHAIIFMMIRLVWLTLLKSTFELAWTKLRRTSKWRKEGASI